MYPMVDPRLQLRRPRRGRHPHGRRRRPEELNLRRRSTASTSAPPRRHLTDISRRSLPPAHPTLACPSTRRASRASVGERWIDDLHQIGLRSLSSRPSLPASGLDRAGRPPRRHGLGRRSATIGFLVAAEARSDGHPGRRSHRPSRACSPLHLVLAPAGRDGAIERDAAVLRGGAQQFAAAPPGCLAAPASCSSPEARSRACWGTGRR